MCIKKQQTAYLLYNLNFILYYPPAVIIWLSILRGNLTHLVTPYCCNRNVTPKTVRLPAEYLCKDITIQMHQWNKVHFV
jgi:hypothetical protein